MINSLIVATSNALLATTLALPTYALSRFKLVGQENIFFWTSPTAWRRRRCSCCRCSCCSPRLFADRRLETLDTRSG